jgi:hypothetical protein
MFSCDIRGLVNFVRLKDRMDRGKTIQVIFNPSTILSVIKVHAHFFI